MAVPRYLGAGVPRLYRDHRTRQAREYGACFADLEAAYDLAAPLARRYAVGVADAYVRWRCATRGLDEAAQLRATGRGRRPSDRAVERLRRRQGLEWSKYEAALRRLDEIAGKRAVEPDPLAAVRRAVAEANRP
jgi:hypothetical protein